MPAWLTTLLTFLKDHPEALSDLLEIVKRILDLLEKHPDLAQAVVGALDKE